MEGLEFSRAYLGDLSCLSKGHFNEHLEDIAKVLILLQKANHKLNVSKLSFSKTEIKYLGYVVTCEGITSQTNKIEAMQKIAQLSALKEVRMFLGMIQYSRDIWQKHSHIFTPLIELAGRKKREFESNEFREQEFQTTNSY